MKSVVFYAFNSLQPTTISQLHSQHPQPPVNRKSQYFMNSESLEVDQQNNAVNIH